MRTATLAFSAKVHRFPRLPRRPGFGAAEDGAALLPSDDLADAEYGLARVAEIVVPFMAGIYLLAAIIVIVMNLPAVPGALWQIVGGALGLTEAAGGVAGSVAAAAMNGIKRGLFSNEAGMGSAPNIAAVATPDPHHPSSQGFVQALGVFIDTILVCSATAVMIILSGVMEPGSGVTGTVLTQNALVHHFGAAGGVFVAVAIFFFAFTSIIGNYAYAENAFSYLGFGSKTGLTVLRVAAVLMVIWGAIQSVATVFNLADASMGLMATINLIAIIPLGGVAIKLLKDYSTQKAQGKDPVFHRDSLPELKNVECWDGTDPECQPGGHARLENIYR